MARHRLLTSALPRCALQLLGVGLGWAMGAAFASACSEPSGCGGEPTPIQAGTFTVTAARSDDASASALLVGPEPATLSIRADEVRIDYLREGVPISVVYTVVSQYE